MTRFCLSCTQEEQRRIRHIICTIRHRICRFALTRSTSGKSIFHVGLPGSGLSRVCRYGYVGPPRPGQLRVNPYIGILPLLGGCPPTLVPEAGAVLQPRMKGHGRFTRKPASLADHRHNICRRDSYVGKHFISQLDISLYVGSFRLAGKTARLLRVIGFSTWQSISA